MILVTVGAQMPFDRLVLAVDAWASGADRCAEVFAQIGDEGIAPASIEWTRFLEPDEFRRRLEQTSLLVAHAGTGSIFCALEFGIPVLVMPRHAAKGETRNDHQIATARRFEALGHVHVAWDEHEVASKIDTLLSELDERPRVAPCASPELLDALSDFVAAS
ncbi:MAG: glucuronosyltransferase [Planctomycetes bacterium]|nr:glucuronosyltransferase [Planctomycetota bacterium]